MFILDDLLIGLPAKGLGNIFLKIYEMAQAELNDETRIKDDLLQLQTMYEVDAISDEEYEEKEAELLERLTVTEGVIG
jgi:hypothetical protein